MSKRSNPFSAPMYVDVKDLPELAHRRFGATREVLPFNPAVQDESPSRGDESSTEPQRLMPPARYTKLEPSRPLSAFIDDPLFNPKAAARILGVSVECLKKWRQRKRGPSYIQYGEDGPVRYALSALKRFQAQHTLHPEREQ